MYNVLLQNAREDMRDLQLKLETALNDYVELEAKYKEVNNKCISLGSEIKSKEKEINTFKDTCNQLQETVKETVGTLEEYKINLAAEKKNNEDVKNQLHAFIKESADKIKREVEAKAKVTIAKTLKIVFKCLLPFP